VILAVGLPLAVAASTVLADRPGTTRMAVVAALVAVLLIGVRWRMVRNRRAPDDASNALAADDVMAG
jgi:membrane protein implicated in regulation of membrane protease activity